MFPKLYHNSLDHNKKNFDAKMTSNVLNGECLIYAPKKTDYLRFAQAHYPGSETNLSKPLLNNAMWVMEKQ
jgi:hypothetical protein